MATGLGVSGQHMVPIPEGMKLGEDFPIVCEKCLGNNPYVRMQKVLEAKECKISGRPMHVFRWKPSGSKWKETVVAAEVAITKNVCQSCLMDLELGLPSHVIDELVAALPGHEDGPTSDVNKEFYWETRRRAVQDGQQMDDYGKLRANVGKLREFARAAPYIPPKPRTTPMTEAEQQAFQEKKLREKLPPKDRSITTIMVGGYAPNMSLQDLRSVFGPYGELRELKIDMENMSAYATYRERGAAELAMKAMYDNVDIKGTKLRLRWHRKSSGYKGGNGSAGGASDSTPSLNYKQPSAPPGVNLQALPPGIKLPQGVKYPSQNPDSTGARQK